MDFSALLATQTTSEPPASSKVTATKTKTYSDSSYGAVMKKHMQANKQTDTNKSQNPEAEKVNVAVSELITDIKEVLEDADSDASLSELLALIEGELDATVFTELGEETDMQEVSVPTDTSIPVENPLDRIMEKINSAVSKLMESLQGIFNQLQNQTDMPVNQQMASFEEMEQAIARLLGQLSKEQVSDLTKVLSQLQNLLSQQKDLSKLDPKVLLLLNRFNTFKEQLSQSQMTQSQQLSQPQQSKEQIISFMQTAQSSLSGESTEGQTQGGQTEIPAKQQPFLLRTDMTKVLWQSEMSKVQQLSLNVEMKGNQVNAESFMKGLDKLLSSSAFLKNGAMSKLVIKLNPENLGSIRIEIVQSQTALVAKLHVQNEQVKSLIESQLSGLKQSFAAQNVQVDRFEISSNIDFDKYQRQFQQGNFNQSGDSKEGSDKTKDENEASEEVNFKGSLAEMQQMLEEESI